MRAFTLTEVSKLTTQTLAQPDGLSRLPKHNTVSSRALLCRLVSSPCQPVGPKLPPKYDTVCRAVPHLSRVNDIVLQAGPTDTTHLDKSGYYSDPA